MDKKILLVDDDPSFREIWREKIKAEGFEVIEASSGEEALNILNNIKPDLILLDMLMPGMNGAEVFLKIKENPELKDIKVIFVTNMDEEGEDFELLREYHKKLSSEIGAFDYLAKTTDLDKLIDRIKEALSINQ